MFVYAYISLKQCLTIPFVDFSNSSKNKKRVFRITKGTTRISEKITQGPGIAYELFLFICRFLCNFNLLDFKLCSIKQQSKAIVFKQNWNCFLFAGNPSKLQNIFINYFHVVVHWVVFQGDEFYTAFEHRAVLP